MRAAFLRSTSSMYSLGVRVIPFCRWLFGVLQRPDHGPDQHDQDDEEDVAVGLLLFNVTVEHPHAFALPRVWCLSL